MIKKLFVMMGAMALAASVHAQGFVNFNTQTLGIKIFDTDGATALSGNTFDVQLFAADGSNISASSLVAVGQVDNFRGGLNAGYVLTTGTNYLGQTVNPSVQVTTVANGTVTLQVRAWDSAYSSYAAAVAAGAKYGSSATFTMASAAPPTTPPNMTGFTSFNLVNPAPEPSTIALGALGGLSLLFVRRRK